MTPYGTGWNSTNTAVASVASEYTNLVGAGGASGFTNSINLDTNNPRTNCAASPFTVQNQSITAKPVITGPTDVWWFNGQNPGEYPISITLQSSGGNGTIWGVTVGSEKVSTNPTGSTITISSTGSSFSSSPGDITITAQVNYVTSDPLHITTHKPAYAVQPNSVTNCDSNYGYETDITYIVEDQLLNPMTAGITWNEKWSTPETPVYPNENWGRPLEIGGRNSGQYLMDIITGPFVNNSPANIPQPTCGGAASEVQYWGQQFYVGTLTSGDGVLINSHTFARYTQHAEHQ